MAPRKVEISPWLFTAGRLSLDFVGTVGYRPSQHVERLTDPAALRRWLLDAGLPAERFHPSPAELDRARGVREALYALLDAAIAPSPGDTAAAGPLPAVPKPAALLNEVAAVPPPAPSVVLRPDGAAVIEWAAPPDLDPLLSLIVRDGLDLLGSDLLSQVRRCDAEDCRKLFLDTAPRPRRWCSAQACGTRHRVAAHRARRRPTPHS